MKTFDKNSSSTPYETTDANPRHLWQFVIGTLACLGLILAILAMIYKTNHNSIKSPERFEQISSIRKNWKEIDAENQKHLTGYRWIDQNHGTLQVPIERAMELIEEKEEHP
ncbi:hypothetical protein JIN85_06570 [Luteolibacter pohnpeiensis]|uniref:Uncharacterized protein n=1 Tax=Luteolibacter pohnpeiensis TaxID=454153 RepID=A0A934S3Z8_9BACT|nr:hypothetical protein [Luteolibacter pohnpeiensis]MBK1882071.1 hypothetical protein [Luteolibacter pohnpeiensis]